MFWGLIMEPQRRYTQKVKKAFHISMASLDVSTSSDDPAQVMCGFEGRNYLLCTLRKPDILQVPLDLNFEVGDELSLAANGKCHVHLTGYLTDEFDEEMEEEEEMEDEEEVVEKQKKKNKKRNKTDKKDEPPMKKTKVSGSDDDEEDDNDSDLDIKTLLDKSLAETDEDDVTFTSDEEAEEEEDNDEDSEDSEGIDEDEESSLSEDDSDGDQPEEQPPKKTKKSKLNGVVNNTQEKPEQPTTPKQKEKKKQPQSETKSPQKGQPSPKKKTLQGGVQIEDIREGEGPVAKAGKLVSVYYEGRLKQNNKVFDSSNKGSGFSFRLGAGEVIKGWEIGVAGMKTGGKRRVICPPAMAYGAKGSPPVIPANSHLVFEIELKKVR